MVLLSRDESYRVRSLVTVALMTTIIRHIPVEVSLGPGDGLSKLCVANLDTILTLRKSQLTRVICSLQPEKIEQLNLALKFALAIP